MRNRRSEGRAKLESRLIRRLSVLSPCGAFDEFSVLRVTDARIELRTTRRTSLQTLSTPKSVDLSGAISAGVSVLE
jgi:hypothetical protein